MTEFKVIWPRIKGAILSGIAVFFLLMLVLQEPAFLPPSSFNTIPLITWGFVAGIVVMLLLGFKLTFFPRVIIRCTEEGVCIPQHKILVPWRNVVSIARSRIKISAVQMNGSASSRWKPRYTDAIKITFDSTVSLSTRFQYNEFRAEQPNVYLFSTNLSRLSADEIESLLKALKDSR